MQIKNDHSNRFYKYDSVTVVKKELLTPDQQDYDPFARLFLPKKPFWKSIVLGASRAVAATAGSGFYFFAPWAAVAGFHSLASPETYSMPQEFAPLVLTYAFPAVALAGIVGATWHLTKELSYRVENEKRKDHLREALRLDSPEFWDIADASRLQKELSSRVYLVLAEHQGQFVSERDLINRVFPGLTVENTRYFNHLDLLEWTISHLVENYLIEKMSSLGGQYRLMPSPQKAAA